MSLADTTLRALRPLIAEGPLITLATAITFFEVAREEGLTVTDYTRRTGQPLTTTSRQLLDLGDIPRAGMRHPLGLVSRRQDLEDLRVMRYYLTDKGRALLYRMGRAASAT